MEAIEEETLNGVPGIDDPDDDVPWAANVSFPDDESRTGHQEGQDTERDGWKGPIGLGAGNARTLYSTTYGSGGDPAAAHSRTASGMTGLCGTGSNQWCCLSQGTSGSCCGMPPMDAFRTKLPARQTDS